MRRVVCLSGGLDSSTTAAMLCGTSDIFPLFFDYGQEPIEEELAAAEAVVAHLGIRPLTIRHIQMSLTPDPNVSPGTLSPYFVPHRNLVFAAHAQNYAAAIAAGSVTFGLVADTDPSAFPDASGSFLAQVNALASLYSKAGTWATVDAPCIGLYKRDLIRYALANSFPCNRTYSCYHKGDRCGQCPACAAVIGAFRDVRATIAADAIPALDGMNPYDHSRRCALI